MGVLYLLFTAYNVWAEFREGVSSAAVDVCGVRQQKGQRRLGERDDGMMR